MRAPTAVPSSLDVEYWSSAKEGRLLLQRCKQTGRFQHYPRAHSVHARSRDLEWVESSGEGTIVTFTILQRSFYENVAAGTAIVVVALDEGVQVTGHLENAVDVPIAIGQRVVCRFADSEVPRLLFHMAQ
jgi:uncharacterized OB-fold protein